MFAAPGRTSSRAGERYVLAGRARCRDGALGCVWKPRQRWCELRAAEHDIGESWRRGRARFMRRRFEPRPPDRGRARGRRDRRCRSDAHRPVLHVAPCAMRAIVRCARVLARLQSGGRHGLSLAVPGADVQLRSGAGGGLRAARIGREVRRQMSAAVLRRVLPNVHDFAVRAVRDGLRAGAMCDALPSSQASAGRRRRTEGHALPGAEAIVFGRVR